MWAKLIGSNGCMRFYAIGGYLAQHLCRLVLRRRVEYNDASAETSMTKALRVWK